MSDIQRCPECLSKLADRYAHTEPATFGNGPLGVPEHLRVRSQAWLVRQENLLRMEQHPALRLTHCRTCGLRLDHRRKLLREKRRQILSRIGIISAE